MASELVSCFCKKCDTCLCTYLNAWTWITKSYSTYERPKLYQQPGLVTIDETRVGNAELEGCMVQPLNCKGCQRTLGVYCVEAPQGKKQHERRSFLKLDKMTVKQISNGKTVTAMITAPAPDHDDTDMHDGESERQTSESTSGSAEAPPNSRKVSPDPNVVTLLEGQRKDIDRILTNMKNLQKEMRSMAETLDDLKARPTSDPNAAMGPTVSTEELEVLTKIVTQHSSKVNSVDGLQLELEMMRHRIKRVEEANSRAAIISPKTGQFARMTGSLARRSVPIEKPRPVLEVADVQGQTVIEGTPDARGRDDTESVSLEPTGCDGPHTVLKAPARNVNIEMLATTVEVAANGPAQVANTNTDYRTNVALEDLGPGEPSQGETPLQTLQDNDTVMDDVTIVPQTQADSSYHPSTAQSTLQSVLVDSTTSTANDELDDSDYPERPATASSGSRSSLRGRARGGRRGRGIRRSLPVRLPTPEWEKPDWAGVPAGASTYTSPASRGRAVRRGGSGHISIVDTPNKRPKTESILTSGTVNGGKMRDEEGFLLKPNGKRDGRSMMMKARKHDM